MAQGWTIDAVGHSITFLEPPANGAAISVTEYAALAIGGTNAWAIGAWSAHYGYPSRVAFFSDRMWWARSAVDEQTIWVSQTGDYANFGHSTPIVDSDAITFQINTRSVNAVQELLPTDRMFVLSTDAEFLVQGGQNNVITPSAVSASPQSHCGATDGMGLLAGDRVLFRQMDGQHVQSIAYQLESDKYIPDDLSVWADHLVEAHSFGPMAWAKAPWRVVWQVRDDGVLVGCTFLPEQQVIGWHHHVTDGNVIDCVTMPGSQQTETHMLVVRQVNGVSRVYVEQLADFYIDTPADAVYVDAAVTYDGRNTGSGTVVLSGGVTWASGETITLSASGALFVGLSDVGDGFVVTGADGSSVSVVITAFADAHTVSVQPQSAVPASLRGVATTAWALQRNTISGLGHLEGCAVRLLVDGAVHRDLVVSSGAIQLDYPGGVVQVGLAYSATLQTLQVNTVGGKPIRGDKKLMQSVDVLVRNSVGVKIGTTPTDLWPMIQREFEPLGSPTLALTGSTTIPVSCSWGTESGQVWLVSDDPVPTEILSITPRGIASDSG